MSHMTELSWISNFLIKIFFFSLSYCIQTSNFFLMLLKFTTLISLVNLEVGKNVEGVQKVQKHQTWWGNNLYGMSEGSEWHQINPKWAWMTLLIIQDQFGWKIFKKSTYVEGVFFCGGWNFSKSVSVTSHLLERWVYIAYLLICFWPYQVVAKQYLSEQITSWKFEK